MFGNLAKYLLLIFKNVRRNLLRSILTAGGTALLVLVITLIWSVLDFLDQATSEKAANFKIIVTERWQIPSRMPVAYASSLREGAAREPGDVRPTDSMTWQFYGGTIDATKRTRENFLFFICTQPDKVATMMDELEDLQGGKRDELLRAIEKMKAKRNGVLIGEGLLKRLKKRVGDRMTITSVNFKGIDLEVEVVDTFPPGTRYDLSAVMNADYLNAAFDDYKAKNKGTPHPLADRTLGLVWLRVNNREDFERLAAQVMNSPSYTNPAVKCDTQASGISTFLEAYKDIFWAMRWLLAPAVLATLSLVIANAISISVRERRMEIAVLKVLGFRPGHILWMVLGEALLIGAASGLFSAGAAYLLVNKLFGGIPFPIAFFPSFRIPIDAVMWGFTVGTLTALAGSIIPAWSARSVRVAEVFSKIA